MNNDTALILLLADRQREIEDLRGQVQHLTGLLEQAGDVEAQRELDALRAEVERMRQEVRSNRPRI